MKLELVARKDVSRVLLEKDEKYGLGITFTDGTKDEAGPIVKKVKLKGPAGKSFAVDEGDVILSLNGCSTVGTKSKDIIRMIKEAGNSVDIKLQYETRELRISQSGVYRKQRLKTELQKVNDSFGFILRKRESKDSFVVEYPVISNIKDGSQLYKNGHIQEGDRLLKVDSLSLSWLSLADIACVLHEKDAAEFTFEYNIRVVNFSQTGMKVDLDITVPAADLGIDLRADSQKCDFMYIDDILSGSIAERCGVFREGDIVLSINEIDTKFLTALKANTLLQDNRKCRKITFIPSNRTELKTLNVKVLFKNRDSKRDTATPGSNSDQVCEDWKHVNTPASSNKAFSLKQRSCFKEFCHNEQIKAINILQNIARVMKDLKQNLSQVTSAAFEKKRRNIKENCIFCNRYQHSANLCTSCLAEMNTKCAQSMDILQNFITHFVALLPRNLHLLNENEGKTQECGINLISVPVENLVRALVETLPKVFPGVPELREKFKVLAQKIISSDTSCNICDYEVKSVWIDVQKLLLLLSLEDRRPEVEILIQQLLCYLLDDKFSSDSESAYPTSSVDDCASVRTKSLSSSSTWLQQIGGNDSSFESNVNTTQTNLESESNEISYLNDSSLNIPQINISMQKDYLKITRIQSLSESVELCSENEFCEGDMARKSPVKNDCEPFEVVTIPASSSVALNTKYKARNRDKKVYKDKGLRLKPAKVWRSLDSLLTPDKTLQKQSDIEDVLSPNPPKCTLTNLNGMVQDAPSTSFSYPLNNLSPSHEPVTNGEHASDSKGESTPSSFKNSPQNRSRTNFKKTRTDTVEVKMTNKGEGFGLELGGTSSSAKTSVAPVPVICAIKSKSPSQKSGILKVDDRVVSINHRSILGLTPKELQTLKNRAFSADTISLIIEFDVVEAELTFGTFDVVLDKTLKIGLVFEDMQRGFPMIVSGIVKGSAAHRCGQLFPGDKINFFRCIRNEEFDPVSCNYIKEESVLITVQRDPPEGLQEKSSNSSPCYFNPCFSHRDSVPRRGTNFVVKSTGMHAVEGTDALVLDQEVTLFRDPVFWDFGFLVGENPETGRAYVTDVRPEGPAFESGVIKKFDRIIEVNGILVDKNLENSVLSLLSQTNHKVDLLIRRLYHDDSKSV